MRTSSALREIESLDPLRDHRRITFLCLHQEFAWDAQRAFDLALLKSFCVPSISRVLVHSGELEERPQRRYDDTEILLSELVEHGYDSERGLRAIKRMNQMHARFEIDNADYLYVLSTFLFEPIRFIDRFGYRPTLENERLALFHFWREVGLRMNVREIPEDYERYAQWNRAFERDHFRFSESNRRVGLATTRLFTSWFPRAVQPAVKWGVYALLEREALEAFGFPDAPSWLRRATQRALRTRARVLRVLPARAVPALRSTVTRPSHPCGYHIEQLGPAPELSAPVRVGRKRRPKSAAKVARKAEPPQESS